MCKSNMINLTFCRVCTILTDLNMVSQLLFGNQVASIKRTCFQLLGQLRVILDKREKTFLQAAVVVVQQDNCGKKKKKILPCRRQVQNLIVGIVNESITFHSKALSMYGNQKGALHEPSAKKGKHRM